MIVFGIFGEKPSKKNLNRAEKFCVSKRFKKEGKFENEFLTLYSYKKQGESSKQETMFSNEFGVMVGNICCSSQYNVLNKDEISNVFKLNFKETLKKYWGAYLLIKINKKKSVIEILRDPTGQISFFYLKINNNIFFSNEISLIYCMTLLPVEFYDEYLQYFLLNGAGMHSNYTPFKKIKELPSGCTISFLKEKISDIYVAWNPYDFYKTPLDENLFYNKFTHTFLNVSLCSISQLKKVYVDCSGGLDSTAVLFFLKEALKSNQILKAINIFHPFIASSNELHYAKKIAQEAEIELLEFDSSQALPFSPLDSVLLPPNKPDISLIRMKIENDINVQIEDGEKVKIFSGEGGDHIFMCPPAVESICDIIIDKKFNCLYEKIKEIGMQHRISFWKICGVSFKNLARYFFNLNYKNIDVLNYFQAPWFLKKIKIKESYDFLHPIYKQKNRESPGKFFQIDSLYHSLSGTTGDIRGNDILHPLLSQPIIEIALAMPTYKMYDKGYDRYPFRRAVSDFFNTSSVWRKDKGEETGVYQRGIIKNKNFILDLCSRGYFYKNKLIDMDLLLDNINSISTGQADYQWSLIHLISLELFIRYWKDFSESMRCQLEE